MSPNELRQMQGFIKWAEEGEKAGYLSGLQGMVEEVSERGFNMEREHLAHINHGSMLACRVITKLIGELARPQTQVAKAPPATYGVRIKEDTQ